MSAAAQVEAAAGRLREAGARWAERPLGERVARIGRVLERFRDPAEAPRRRLARELPAATGFGEANVRAGLALALEGWTAEALAALVERELGGSEALRGVELAAIVLGGALPMPTLHQLLAALVCGAPVLVRAASADRLTAAVLADALAQEDAGLGACLECVGFAHEDAAAWRAFCAAPCVVATGSDEAIARIAARVPAHGRFVGYGHRLSLAAVDAEAVRERLPATAEALALDVALWDQLGCLSPIAVFVDASDGQAPRRLALALAEALAKLEARIPRGRIEARAAARFSAERAEAEFRASQGDGIACLADAEGRWCVTCEADAAPRAAPLFRFVRVQPVAGPRGLLSALGPYAEHLAGVALAGFGGQEAALRRLGATRLCAPGRLQAPPLDWARDARGVLRPFLKAA